MHGCYREAFQLHTSDGETEGDVQMREVLRDDTTILVMTGQRLMTVEKGLCIISTLYMQWK